MLKLYKGCTVVQIANNRDKGILLMAEQEQIGQTSNATGNSKRIYFNNAAGAYPLAPGVTEAVTKALQEPPRVSGRDVSASSDSLQLCRKALADILGASAEQSQIVLTPGATYGLNTAILGLGLQRGDLVISTVTEHNSVLRPLARLEKQFGVRVEYIPLDSNARLNGSIYNDLLKEKPRLVVMSHASNVTGRVNPVRKWFEDAKSAGAFTLLDASQTAGRISVIPAVLYADMVVFPGHKGLRGPLGTGVLYVSPEVTLEPVYTGGTGIKSDLRFHPEEMPLRLEAGTPNTPAFAGLYAALLYYIRNANEIAAKETEITKRLYAGLSPIPNIRILDSDISEFSIVPERLPIISFSVNGMDAETVGFALSESFGIECRAGLHCAPLIHGEFGVDGSVRLSPSYVTDMNAIDYATEAVRTIAVQALKER